MPKQAHRANGQFDTRMNSRMPYADRNDDEPKLTEKIDFRLSSRDYRKAQIMFDQNRKIFGWETCADMWRDMLLLGAGEYIKKIPNPDPELLRMQRSAEELEEFMAGAMKHVRLTELCAKLDECVQQALEAGDLSMVRKFLARFKEWTREETDPMMRERREEYFDRKWSRLWDSLNRGARLPIDG